MKRSKTEIHQMYHFLDLCKPIYQETAAIKIIENLYAAVDEIEEDKDEIESYWKKEYDTLKEENELLRNDLKILSKEYLNK